MLNYVALFFLGWLIVQRGVQDPDRSDAISKAVDGSARLPRLLESIGPSLRVSFGIVLAVLVTWGVAWLLRRSTFGFELRAVGLNPDASRTAGISVGVDVRPRDDRLRRARRPRRRDWCCSARR